MSSYLIAAAASPADFYAARMQMALSLGWHIFFSCMGVALPAVMLFAEWRGHRRGDADALRLARRWSKATGVLFAVGAVSGTILSFEMGLLWPGMMGVYGEVIGLPFTMEGVSFFLEAIFIGIYLYGWDRLSPRAHMLSAVPIVITGMSGTMFVVSANAWMNQPTGFTVENGKITSVQPLGAMFNPAMPPQVLHMLLAAYIVVGFSVASVYAVGMLRGRRDRYHRLGFLIPFTMAACVAPVQLLVGDYAAHFVADYQPVKLAAMEGAFETERGAPLNLGGIVINDQMRFSIQIPKGLSLLAHWDPNAEIVGLNEFPRDQHPPVNVVHLAFQTMVGLGTAMAALAVWFAFIWWRKRDLPRTPWFLRAASVAGIAAVGALEAGWVTTEVGRQPWIVFRRLRVADAVNPASWLTISFAVVALVYAVLTVATVFMLRRIAKTGRAKVAPQEPEAQSDAEEFDVPLQPAGRDR